MSMVIYQSYFLVFSTDTSAHTVRSILERLTDLCKHKGRFSVRLKLFYNILEQFSTRTVLKIDVTQLSLIFFSSCSLPICTFIIPGIWDWS